MAQTSLNSTGVASSGALSLQSNGTTEAIGISTGQVATLAQNPILTSGTANGVAYLNGSKVLTTGSALVFDGSNLGVGVTPSVWGQGRSFELNDTGYGLWNGGNSIYSVANMYFNGGFKYANTGQAASHYYQFQGAHVWSTAPSGTAGNAISFTQAMTLTASGALGIGITSPTAKLDVVSSSGSCVIRSYASASADSYLETKSSTGSAFYGIDATGAYIYTDTAVPIRFFTSSTERARIDSSGNLLVGTTSTGLVNATAYAFQLDGQGIRNSHGNGTPSGYAYEQFGYAGSSIGSITQAGTTGVLYNVTSDYRLKTVIGPVANAGQRIDALEPIEYEWKADGSRTRGFLAHQFQEVYAGSVSGTKDAVDAEGKPVYQSMQASSSEVIADLVAEIQSLRKRLAALESK